MSELYKQSIIEAKKLKEIAEIDARNKIIEAVAPVIKKMIATEAADASRFLFGEEDAPGGIDGVADTGDLASLSSAEVSPEEPTMTPGDMPNAAPISPSDGLVGMPMPDDEGKITVDFQQLFSLGGGGAEAAPPVAGGMDSLGAQGETPNAPASPEMVSPPASPVDASSGQPAAPAPVAPIGPTGTAPTQGPEAPTSPTGLPPTNPEDENEPTPVVAGEAKIFGFKEEVRVVAEKIDYLYFKGNVPMLVKESLKSKLFTLCEKLDEMVNEDVISSKKARLAENKLEFLFMKLNEAESTTSYKENKGASMTTLKEFAAKLFEEDALGPATADKATAHAEKTSGVAPGVDLFKEGEAPKADDSEMSNMAESLLGEDAPASSNFGDGKVEGDAQTKTPRVHNPDALIKEPGAGIAESAPASSNFGDGEKTKGAENTSPKVHSGEALIDKKGNNSILEFDEKELREAVAKLRKENLSRRLAAVKKESALKGTDKDGHLKPPSVPEGDQGSQKPAGGKAPAQSELKECGMENEDATSMGTPGAAAPMGAGPSKMPMEDAPAGGEHDMAGAGGGEVELTFQIDVDDLEALLNGATEEFSAEPVAGDAMGAAAGAGDDDALSIDLVGDDGDSAPEMGAGKDDDDASSMLMDKDKPGKDESKMPMESKKPASTKKPLTEAAVIAKAATTVKALQSQLSESKLLTAKALYVSKFAVREDLTKTQKQKIASYFDKAKSLAEAKETYTKIKKILAESTSSTQLSGSASKPTSTGSARLTESAQPKAGEIETARWQLLAGIKNRK